MFRRKYVKFDIKIKKRKLSYQKKIVSMFIGYKENRTKNMPLVACLNSTSKIVLCVSTISIHSSKNWIVIPKIPSDRKTCLNNHSKEDNQAATKKNHT